MATPELSLRGMLPIPRTRLIGRGSERAVSEARLLDDVIWVDLAPVTDPLLIPDTVASALDLVPRAEEPLTDQLVRVLRPRQTLLLLDNCEHLLEGTAELAMLLLARCPALQVLATSRAPLHLRGERLLLVEPLAVPEAKDVIPRDDLDAFPAVTLFCERA